MLLKNIKPRTNSSSKWQSYNLFFQIDDFIKSHTSQSRGRTVFNKSLGRKVHQANPYGTYRNSKTTAFAWKDKMDINYIYKIQDSCHSSMQKLGYNFIKKPEQREDPDFDLVVKTKDEVWPFNWI